MDNKIVLSICILVRNQPEDVSRLLANLVPQLKDGVEIVIRDGGDSQETENHLKIFSGYRQIRYERHLQEGFDEKIVSITESAKGEYVWWMGDDEVVDGAVDAVLKILKGERVNYIWVNYKLKDKEKFGINLVSDRYFNSRDEILELGGAGLGFISSTILKRCLALEGIKLSRKFIGSQFLNLSLVLHVLSCPGKCYYLHGPFVICHRAMSEEIKEAMVEENGVIKNPAFEIYGINFPRIIYEFSNIFDPGVIRKVIKKNFGTTWRGILVGWAGGWDTPKGKRLQMLKLYWSYPECWIALPLFCMPRSIVWGLYQIYKIFYSHRELILRGRLKTWLFK